MRGGLHEFISERCHSFKLPEMNNSTVSQTEMKTHVKWTVGRRYPTSE